MSPVRLKYVFVIGARSASDAHNCTAGETPSITLEKPSSRQPIKEDSSTATESPITSGVARMTFPTGSKTQSGFTPDKEQDKRPEPVQQEV